MIIDRKVCFNGKCAFTTVDNALARSINYAFRGIIYNHNNVIAQATVATIVNYDRNTFIVQSTDCKSLYVQTCLREI
jgi:hypothetical protein